MSGKIKYSFLKILAEKFASDLKSFEKEVYNFLMNSFTVFN
jgi:hypothetical protein